MIQSNHRKQHFDSSCESKETTFFSDDFENKNYDEIDTSINDSYQNISIDKNGKEYLEKTPLHDNIKDKKLNEEQKLERIKQCIKEGYDINTQTNKGMTLLHYASLSRSVKITKYLIEQKADINLKNKEGESVLHCAALQGKLEIIKLFIEEQINPNIKDKSGSTPLHHASYKGRLRAIKYLIEKGADFNVKNQEGSTPLHCAALQGKLEIIKLFIEEKNVNPNIKDKSGSTPLHQASYKGRLRAIKYLIEKGADFNVKNQEGNTPLDFAKKNERNDVVNYLELQNSKRVVINARFALTILCLTIVPYLATLYTAVIILIMTFSLTKLLTHRIEKSCKGIGEENGVLSTSRSSELTSISFESVNNDRYISS